MPDATNLNGSTVSNLVGVDDLVFDVPAPLITPAALPVNNSDWTVTVATQAAP